MLGFRFLPILKKNEKKRQLRRLGFRSKYSQRLSSLAKVECFVILVGGNVFVLKRFFNRRLNNMRDEIYSLKLNVSIICYCYKVNASEFIVEQQTVI